MDSRVKEFSLLNFVRCVDVWGMFWQQLQNDGYGFDDYDEDEASE